MTDKLHRHPDAAAELEARARTNSPGKVPVTARLFPTALFRSAMTSARGQADIGPRDDNGVAAGASEAVAQAGGSSGTPLPDELRTRFEGSLGADLSGVRVHTGPDSQAAADAVGARAYAVGNDIHFGAGQ